MFFQVGRVNWGANAANTNIISAVNVVTPCVLVDGRIKFVFGFTTQYNVIKLVYYEIFNDIQLAAAREKRLKEWKIDLKKMNRLQP